MALSTYIQDHAITLACLSTEVIHRGYMKKNFLLLFIMSIFALVSSKTFASDLCREKIIAAAGAYGINLEADKFSQYSSLKELVLTPELFNQLTAYEQEVYYELLRPLSHVRDQYLEILESTISEFITLALTRNEFVKYADAITFLNSLKAELAVACQDI